MLIIDLIREKRHVPTLRASYLSPIMITRLSPGYGRGKKMETMGFNLYQPYAPVMPFCASDTVSRALSNFISVAGTSNSFRGVPAAKSERSCDSFAGFLRDPI